MLLLPQRYDGLLAAATNWTPIECDPEQNQAFSASTTKIRACGALIPRNDYEQQVERINQFWNGFSLEDIRGCVLRCREQASPGVIVIAVGRTNLDRYTTRC